jgi:7,8-dihydropterin-6-yl-methyl-4-(beta-D-ribofuranosyl)aminobenzene 5'-phosphate synthase
MKSLISPMRFFGIGRGIVRKIFLTIIVIVSFCPVSLFGQTRGQIVKIVTLIEDTKINESKDIVAAHGMSLYIEKNGQRILFDTGPSSEFIRNSEKLGVDLKKVDIAIISHAHMDHMGGLTSFLWINKKANVYLSRNVLRNQDFRALRSQMDEETFDRIRFVNDSTGIAQDVFILTKIEGRYPIRDRVDHEAVLVIRNNNKLIILSGCSHGEILNIIGTVTRTFPNIYVRAVIGGFHLTGTAKYSVEQIGREMLKYPIMKIYTCHCTGVENYRILKTILGVKIEYISTGSKIHLF